MAGKKSKKSAARDRYWASGRLEKRKVRNLMKHCGLTEDEAKKRWKEQKARAPRGSAGVKGGKK